jgi:hypothetical protein
MHVGSVYQGANLSEITSSITFEKRGSYQFGHEEKED